MVVCVCVCVCWTECKHQAASGQGERCVWANQTLDSAPLHSIASHSPVLTPYVCVIVCIFFIFCFFNGDRCVWANQTLDSAPLHSIATHSRVLTPYVCVIVCSFVKNVTTILSKMIPSQSKLNQHAILHVVNVLICTHGCASFTCRASFTCV